MLTEDNKVGRSKLLAWLEKEIGSAESQVGDFKERLGSEPLRAFRRYGGPAIIAAARIEVLEKVFKALTSAESKATLKSLYEYAENEVINKGVYIGSSTAMLAPHCDRAALAAWVDIYKQMTQIRDHGEPLGM